MVGEITLGNTYIGLSTGLDPDEGVNKRITGVGGWSDTETSANDVAPITLFDLSSWLDTISACRRLVLVLEQ